VPEREGPRRLPANETGPRSHPKYSGKNFKKIVNSLLPFHIAQKPDSLYARV
jgi:hypothetical protein